MGARLLADREVIPQAMKLNPASSRRSTPDLLNTKKTRKSVQAALDADRRLPGGARGDLFGPVLDHLREVGEARPPPKSKTTSSGTSTWKG